ncbi:hypothetical protein ALISP_1387 [Alicycliphilus sp. B1]|nr:hypothetical protein ALISP_1387 [Alicycliphilus sp. B1]
MLAAARRSVLKVPIWFTRMMFTYFSSEPGLPSFSTRRTGPADAGAVHQRAEVAEGLGRRDGLLHLGLVGNVGLHVAQAAGVLLFHGLAALVVQVHGDHLKAALEQRDGRGLAQARDAAGDQGGHSLLQFHFCSFLPVALTHQALAAIKIKVVR